jgi:ankyrin repeat protein
MTRKFRVSLLASALAGVLSAGSALAQDGNEARFLELLASGETRAALEYLGARSNVNQPQPDGTTALHWAIYYDDVDLVRTLIARGADVKARNEFGATPLSQAAIIGNAAVIDLLLEAGVDPDEKGADQQTALMIIARTPNVEAARLLAEAGADVNRRETWRGQTALMWAAAQRQPEMVRFLLEQGADPDLMSWPNNWERQVSAEPRMKILPPGGMSALHYAAREGCSACVRLLLEAGANPDVADPDGVTPLVMAGLNARWDSMKALVEAGANVNKWDVYGRNPLYTVVDYNTLPHGGRADKLSADLTTPLEVAELLIANGANVNLQLKLFPPYRALGADRGADGLLRTGATPLFRAARGGDAVMAKLLIDNGALVDLPQENEVTPLMVAAGYRASAIDTRGRFRTEKQAVEVARLLLAAGADPNYPEENGQTPVFGAATQGWTEMVQLLVEYGADLTVQDRFGATPLDIALGRGGGFGRGSGTDPHPETAAFIQARLDAAKQ